MLGAFTNYAQITSDPLCEMLEHPDTVVGLSDGGAHVKMICDASMPTYLLTHWVRDRTRGERLSLETVVRKQTADTAEVVRPHRPGHHRGRQEGRPQRDRPRPPRAAQPRSVADLPAGGRRLLQDATGYVATIVNGVVTRRAASTPAPAPAASSAPPLTRHPPPRCHRCRRPRGRRHRAVRTHHLWCVDRHLSEGEHRHDRIPGRPRRDRHRRRHRHRRRLRRRGSPPTARRSRSAAAPRPCSTRSPSASRPAAPRGSVRTQVDRRHRRGRRAARRRPAARGHRRARRLRRERRRRRRHGPVPPAGHRRVHRGCCTSTCSAPCSASSTRCRTWSRPAAARSSACRRSPAT